MKSTSESVKTLAYKIRKILWILGLHAFLLILILVLIDILIGGFVFYQYVFTAEHNQPQGTGNVIRFNNNAYMDVLSQLQAREQGGQESSVTSQPNPSK